MHLGSKSMNFATQVRARLRGKKRGGERGGADVMRLRTTDINQSCNVTLDGSTAEEQVYLVVIVTFSIRRARQLEY